MRLLSWFCFLYLFNWCLYADIKSTSGNISFDTNSDGNSNMELDSSGFGVGTHTASANLHVMGNAIITTEMQLGDSNGLSTLGIAGTLGFGIETVSSNATLGDNSMILVDTSAATGNLTLSLPAAKLNEGRKYTIKKISSANTVHLISPLDAGIDGQSGFNLGNAQSELPFLSLMSGGNHWQISSKSQNNISALTGGSSNLIGFWKFDESDVSGTAADSSGYEHHGTYNGTMTNADVVTGVSGNALDFDGTDDYIDLINNSVLTPTDEVTVMAWVKGGSQTTKAVFSHYDFNANNRGIWFGAQATKLRVILSSNGTYTSSTVKDYSSSINVFNNTWVFAALTFDGSTMKIYINGAEDTSPTKTEDGAITAIYDPPVDVRIGSTADNSQLYTGLVDDVRVFNYALSAAQIQAIYDASK